MTLEYKLDGATVKRETEKAILVAVELESGLSSVVGRKSEVWFPKSQTFITELGEVLCSAWILEAKDRDLGRIEATRI